MKAQKRLISVILCAVLLTSIFQPTVSASDSPLSDDIVILYTNDVHSYIDGELSYDVIAGIKADLQTRYKNVFLVDAGDHIQGTAYGAMDSGESVIRLMNAADYDVATLGNHEFDYTMEGCMNAIEWAEFSYLSCNFYHVENGIRGENVLDSYSIFDCGNEKIAFVGITTPETFSKSAPSYFQDGEGNYIYGISGEDDGSALYADVQNAINEAKAEGATTVIALGHLGLDESSGAWTSEETIKNVVGLDGFIDGHSHSVVEGISVDDAEGNDVILTQTGEYFDRIGIMLVDGETGDITTDFIEYDSETGKLNSDICGVSDLISDESVKTEKDAWIDHIDAELGQKIGSANVTLDNYDQPGNRLVRLKETNSGDFSADALYYLFDDMGLDVDVAIMNGGGVRNQAVTGDITYKVCKDIHPFGNVACLQTVTGQQILDMLEWGARHAGTSEDGSFLHVSGITYKIDLSVPNTTKADEMDVWTEGPSAYRVFDVKVYDKDDDKWYVLELDEEYNLAGYNYTLRDLGGGFAMLNGAVNVLDYVMEDYMVLANYIKGFENGTVDAKNSPLLSKYPGLSIDYGSVNGSGRIEVVAPSVWVGGTEITDENASDVFGDGRVSYNAAMNTLTLDGYTYEGNGFICETYEDEEDGTEVRHSAVVYSNGSLNVELIGNSSIKNTFNGANGQNCGDGIIAENKLVIKGSGTLRVEGFYGLESARDLVIDGCVLDVCTESCGIFSWDGSVQIKNGASVWIDSDEDGVYVWNDFTLTDGTLSINAGTDGIYAYNGTVTLDSTSVKVHGTNPTLVGTKLSVNAGGSYGIFAYSGIVVSDKLAVSSPQNARIQKLHDEEDDYWYYTVCSDGESAKELSVEPVGYRVMIENGDYDMVVLVPAGMSVNEAYCEVLQIDDFSEAINPIKDGYSLAGWFTDENCSYGSEFSFDAKIARDTTVYAKWDVSYLTIEEIIAGLEKAEKELSDELALGDKANADALAQAVSELNGAIDAAKTAAETADEGLKAELTDKIDNAEAALYASISSLADELDRAEQKTEELQTLIIIVCAVSGAALCCSGAFAVWFLIDRKKRI